MSELKVGIAHEKSFVVEEEHLASHVGSGKVGVLSTPAMITFMEQTCLEAVEDLLPEGHTTVGTRVDVRHLKPAPLGAEIRVKASLERVEGRKLTFRVEAYWGDLKIGEGIHERYVVDRERFLSKVGEFPSGKTGQNR